MVLEALQKQHSPQTGPDGAPKITSQRRRPPACGPNRLQLLKEADSSAAWGEITKTSSANSTQEAVIWLIRNYTFNDFSGLWEVTNTDKRYYIDNSIRLPAGARKNDIFDEQKKVGFFFKYFVSVLAYEIKKLNHRCLTSSRPKRKVFVCCVTSWIMIDCLISAIEFV